MCYTQGVSTNPNSESVSKLYSEIFKWFNAVEPYNVAADGTQRQPVEDIIVDICYNGGGRGTFPLTQLSRNHFIRAVTSFTNPTRI